MLYLALCVIIESKSKGIVCHLKKAYQKRQK